ncbi:arabinogalactan endo-1,4-beta-galactosidase [Mesobacillus foraminis]|uniref:Arabinogalactan endo-beta-1,4-galactanase n=1 Tax=Mesobacillus foraminis TaxID=279826 RepID=A0A4R2BDZ4_9BACI|nr:arabinogalactan endo-1,4-beta-galactosidase [Mesobacillus foraminis]
MYVKKIPWLKKSIGLLAATVLSVPLITTPASAYYGKAEISPAVTNLTTKSWVTFQAGNGDAGLAFDQDESTYWDAHSLSGSEENWLQVDLGGTYKGLRMVEVVFPSKNGKYKYTLEGSQDGENWFTLSDHASDPVLGGEDVLIQDKPAVRFIKATLLGVSDGAIPGITEIRANNYALKDHFSVGADISWDTGFLDRIHTTQNNTDAPSSDGRMISTMQETSMSEVRFRIWNDPRNEGDGQPVGFSDGSMNPEDTLNKSLYSKSLGMKVGLDFHYSDSWADPGKQIKPLAWKDLEFEELVKAIHDFTYKVTDDHVKAGAAPEFIQVGNEIINGTLWGNEKTATGSYPNYAKNDSSYFGKPGGELLWEYWNSEDPSEQAKYDAAWDRFTAIIDAGLRAVKEASPNSKTKIHVIVDANRLAKTQEFWRQLTTRLKNDYDNNFDIMSISYYPQWHGTMSDLGNYLHAFASEFPEYELAVSETSHFATPNSGPATGYPFTIQGQADFMKDVIRTCNDTINNSCKTMLVWEPVIWQSMFTRIGTSQYWQANDSTRVFTAAFSEFIQKNNEYLATTLYSEPRLPEKIEVLDVKNNRLKEAAVTWDSIPETAYSKLGSFTVNGTSEYGKVTAHVAVTIDVSVLEDLTKGFIETKDLSGPLVPQLTNALKQANHHDEKGSAKVASHFIKKYIASLQKNANEKHLSSEAQNTLIEHAELLLETWNR